MLGDPPASDMSSLNCYHACGQQRSTLGHKADNAGPIPLRTEVTCSLAFDPQEQAGHVDLSPSPRLGPEWSKFEPCSVCRFQDLYLPFIRLLINMLGKGALCRVLSLHSICSITTYGDPMGCPAPFLAMGASSKRKKRTKNWVIQELMF